MPWSMERTQVSISAFGVDLVQVDSNKYDMPIELHAKKHLITADYKTFLYRILLQ